MSDEKTAFKVLHDGKNFHGGTAMAWSLPTQGAEGSWTPGDWHEVAGAPRLCVNGLHCTYAPARFWREGAACYVVEYAGETDGPRKGDKDKKFCATRVRLLRRLTDEELATHGVYLSGTHAEICDGYAWIGGSARVGSVCGSATVGSVYGSARVGSVYDSARVGSVYDSATVERVCGSATVGSVYGSARVGSVCGSARVGSVCGSATAHASADAVVVVHCGTPTVTVQGRASCLDYRPPRPTHHLADEGQVLTLAPDGTTSQTPIEARDE